VSVVGAVLAACDCVSVHVSEDLLCCLWCCLQVYFVGNAPMAHMDISSSSSPDSSSSSPDSSNSSSAPAAPPEKQVFFHLAQVCADFEVAVKHRTLQKRLQLPLPLCPLYLASCVFTLLVCLLSLLLPTGCERPLGCAATGWGCI
jgi:hypothetical protein